MRPRRLFPLLLLLLVAPFPILAQSRPAFPRGSQILQELRAADDQLAAGMTLRLEIEVPADLFDADAGIEVRRGTITTDGSSVAISMASSYPKPLAYREPRDEADREHNFTPEGERILWRNVRQDALYATDRNDSADELQPFLVGHNQLAQKAAPIYARLERRDVGDLNNLRDYNFAMLALGRSYSRYLDGVDAVRALAGGHLEVRGRGTFGPASAGTWTLTVDPAAGYLVRGASYLADGQPLPAITVKADGRSSAGVPLAASGLFQLALGTGSAFTFSARTLASAAEADTAMLGDVRERLEISESFGANLWDRRARPVNLAVRPRSSSTNPGGGGGDDSEPIGGDQPIDDTMPGGGVIAVPVDPAPIDPVCCKCQEMDLSFAECGHFNPPNDVQGCFSDWCIENTVDSATCVKSGSTGQNKCFQVSVINKPWATQVVRSFPGGNCPTGGQAVVWKAQFTHYSGCNGCARVVPDTGYSACNIASCTGVETSRTTNGSARDCAAGSVVVPF